MAQQWVLPASQTSKHSFVGSLPGHPGVLSTPREQVRAPGEGQMAPMNNLHSTSCSTSTYLLSRDIHTQQLPDSPHPSTSPDHHNHFSASFSHSKPG